MAEEDLDKEFWLFGYGSLIWKPPPHYDQRIPGYVTGYIRRFWQASEDHRGTPASPGRVVTLISSAHYATLPNPDPDSPPTYDNQDHRDHRNHRVWGAAFHIPGAHARFVREYLDIREQGGYSVEWTRFYRADEDGVEEQNQDQNQDQNQNQDGHVAVDSPAAAVVPLRDRVLVFIGLPENPHFIGPEAEAQTAEIVAASCGPSGANVEYLLNLEQALHELVPGGVGGEDGVGAFDAHIAGLAVRVRGILGLRDGQGLGSEGTKMEMEEVER